MDKCWGSWSRDPSSIPCSGSHFWFGCGVPFILARSLRNGTKNPWGSLCVCTPHMQSKSPLCLFAKCSHFWRHGYAVQLEYYGKRCTLEWITLSALKTWHDNLDYWNVLMAEDVGYAGMQSTPLIWYPVILEFPIIRTNVASPAGP